MNPRIQKKIKKVTCMMIIIRSTISYVIAIHGSSGKLALAIGKGNYFSRSKLKVFLIKKLLS